MQPPQRYASLVDDPEAFRAACERPLPSVVRVNTLKASVDRARETLDAAGVGHEATDWHPGVLKLDERRPCTSWPYFHRWLHGPAELSVPPALALDPQPGEGAWHACAAPGGQERRDRSSGAVADERAAVSRR